MMSRPKEISIHYYPKDGADWAMYLQSKLGEKEYQINVTLNDVTSDDISQGKSRINVFLITPDFLELIDLNIMKGFDHQYSLAILMGVDTENFTFITKQHGVHEDVKDWITLDVEGSEESVRHLLMTIVTMYEYDYPPPRIRPVFREVIDEGLNIYIGLEKKAESDVSIQFDGKDEMKATYTNRYFYTFSLPDEEAHMFSTFSVICNEHKIGEGKLKDAVPSLQQVTHTEGSLAAGHASGAVGGRQPKLQQLWELLEEEADPINMLCQCMGLSGSEREQLDNKLANKISASGFPEHLSFMDSQDDSSQIQSDQKWPTLLHFAAEYNLLRFAEALLCYPALAGACKIRNIDGRTPDEIAHHSDHQELSEMLRMFSNFILSIHRWSNDSGFGDKVRLSQIKSYFEKGESSESSQIGSPPPAPHVGSNVSVAGYVRPPKPRPVEVVQFPSLAEKEDGLDRDADDNVSATIDVIGEHKKENVKSKLQDSGKTMCRLEEDQETHIKPGTDHGAYPHSKSEEVKEPTLTEKRNVATENISHQQEKLKPEVKKKKGIFSKLLKRKHKPKPRDRSASDGDLESVREFQRKNRDVHTLYTQHEVPAERESDISRSSSVSSHSDTTGNEEEKVMHGVHDDTKAKSKKKIRLFFKNAEIRKSVRLAHAMRDKNISYPSLPSKKVGHLQD